MEISPSSRRGSRTATLAGRPNRVLVEALIRPVGRLRSRGRLVKGLSRVPRHFRSFFVEADSRASVTPRSSARPVPRCPEDGPARDRLSMRASRKSRSREALASRQEELISSVPLLGDERVAEAVQEALKVAPLCFRHLERAEHAAEVRPVVAVVKQADVPAVAELLQELHERPRPLRELEAVEALVPHRGR